MKVCPACHTEFASGANFCPHDGQVLTAAPRHEAADVDPLLGQTLDQRYRLERRLGQGGMGVVYAGHHVLIDKPVAIKLLRPEYSRKRTLVERFVREARAASHIGHPNIVDVTDFGWLADGQAYLVMEQLVGTTLAAEIGRLSQQGQRMSLSRVLDLSVQICQGLGAAHGKGIVHRDLKPENVFLVNPRGDSSLTDEGGYRLDYVKLLDFGIAKFTMDGARLTQLGSVFGTPQYMSPEQAAGRDADHRGDIYALGCMIYELLTGQPPFVSDTFAGTITKQIKQAPRPPLDLLPPGSLPIECEALVLKMLAKDPGQRHQSMHQVSEALRHCLGGKPLGPSSQQGQGHEDSQPDAASPPAARLGETPPELRVWPSRDLPATAIGANTWRRPAAMGVMGLGAVVIVWLLTTYAMPGPAPSSSPTGPSRRPTEGQRGSAPGTAGLDTSLSVHTEPQGATVLYEGRAVGRSPFTAQVPRGSTITYVLRKPGYRSVRRVIEARGERTHLVVPLRRGGPENDASGTPTLRPDRPPTAEDLRSPFPRAAP